MSLVGKLEDLGLGEILQIVALSGKSGVLHVKSRGREGKIFFHKGKVVNAFSDSYKINLGEYLIRKGIVSQDVINKALELQKNHGYKEKLGTILINYFKIPKEKVEESVIELIEKSVFSLFYWREGEFQFELIDGIENEDISIDFLQYDLSKNMGLNPQFLAMEGTRILDEAKKYNPEESLEKFPQKEGIPFPTNIAETTTPSEEKVPFSMPVIFFFDEMPLFRKVIVAHFKKKGFDVITADTLVEAKEKLKELISSGNNFIFVGSLLAEIPDGSGILGGLELIKLIPETLSIPLFVSCDYHIPDVEEFIKQHWNATLIKKPKKSELTKENVEQEINLFLKTLEQSIYDIVNKAATGKEVYDEVPTWDKELKAEFDISDKTNTFTTTPGLKLLKSMVAELSTAETGNEIILMILRLASEIMPRAVLFAIKNNKLFGLGQFGLEKFIPEPQKTVKNLILPLSGKVAEVVQSNMPYKGTPPPEDEIFEKIYTQLGGERPTEVFLAVITSNDKPLVLFYGDNIPGKKNIQDTDALEIFFTQAGLAMERLLMTKK